MPKRTINKNINYTIVIIIILFFLILPIYPTILRYQKASLEKKVLTAKAIKYFSREHNIKKKDIKIVSNGLYGPNKRCWWSCEENNLYIEYNGREYVIEYDMNNNSYSDNY